MIKELHEITEERNSNHSFYTFLYYSSYYIFRLCSNESDCKVSLDLPSKPEGAIIPPEPASNSPHRSAIAPDPNTRTQNTFGPGDSVSLWLPWSPLPLSCSGNSFHSARSPWLAGPPPPTLPVPYRPAVPWKYIPPLPG